MFYNSDCGYYHGYSNEDFVNLLKMLKNVEGKFLMSSYSSDVLSEFTKDCSWKTISIEQKVSVANATGKLGKKKTEVLTANYDLRNPNDTLTLFG